MAIDPPYRLDPFRNIVNVSWEPTSGEPTGGGDLVALISGSATCGGVLNNSEGYIYVEIFGIPDGETTLPFFDSVGGEFQFFGGALIAGGPSSQYTRTDGATDSTAMALTVSVGGTSVTATATGGGLTAVAVISYAGMTANTVLQATSTDGPYGAPFITQSWDIWLT